MSCLICGVFIHRCHARYKFERKKKESMEKCLRRSWSVFRGILVEMSGATVEGLLKETLMDYPKEFLEDYVKSWGLFLKNLWK